LLVPFAIGIANPRAYAEIVADRIVAVEVPEPPATSSDRRCQMGSVVRSMLPLFEA
jgi:hypothetical protein